MVTEDKSWIGVDLDGTLFTYEKWVGWNVFGEPIAPMIDRVQAWISEGINVRIVTARVGLPLMEVLPDGTKVISHTTARNSCHITGAKFTDHMMINAIQDHLEKHGLPRLIVQCYKDVWMKELWDDRAVQVIPNMGITLADEYTARMSAESGKVAHLEVEDKCHPSHDTRISDASSFDEICKKCGATDITGGGWGRLKYPCGG